MEDEDELYDDSLLCKKTFPILNASAMSCSSRQSGRLSLAFRNSSTQMSCTQFRVPRPAPKIKIAIDKPLAAKASNDECNLFGVPKRLICGTLESHQVICKDHSGSAFHTRDQNQNIIKSSSLKRALKGQDAASQENLGAVPKKMSSQRAQLSDQSNVWPSQETAISFNLSVSRSQKPSDVLKRTRLNTRLARQPKHTEIRAELFTLESLSTKDKTPYAIQRFNKQCDSDEIVKIAVVDKLVTKRVPKKKTRRVPKRTWDFSYVEGASTSEADSDDEVKSCPVHKRIPGTSFAVDALCHGKDSRLQAHFLTRYHQENWVQRADLPIYCTPITASLLRQRCQIADDKLRILELGEPRMIDAVKVTAIDAHNEPGSAALLFQLPGNVSVLFVGGLRPGFALESEPLLWCPRLEVDYLVVDTARCDPDNVQILRDELETAVVSIVQNQIEKHPEALVAVVSDGLLEKSLYTRLAVTLGYRVFAHGDAATAVSCIDDPSLNELLAPSRSDAKLHVIPHTSCTFEDLRLQAKQTFSHVVVIRPRKDFALVNLRDLAANTTWNVTILDIPASDGTTFADVERLVRFLRPKRLVSSIAPRRDPIQTLYFEQWLARKDPPVRRKPDV